VIATQRFVTDITTRSASGQEGRSEPVWAAPQGTYCGRDSDGDRDDGADAHWPRERESREQDAADTDAAHSEKPE